MCDTNYSDSAANQQITNFSSVVSPEGAAAFRACVANAQQGLIVDTKFDEASPEIVTLNAHYNRIGRGAANKVRDLTITDSSAGKYPVTCEGTLKDAAQKKALIGTSVLTLTCRRPVQNDPKKSFPIAGLDRGLAFPASVTVATDVGPIDFQWGAIYLPPPVSPIPPAFIGEVRAIAYQWGTGAFQDLSTNGWVECDGRVLKATDYPDLYQALGNTWGTDSIGVTFKIPDLRGQFLRGWSHGTGIDPEAATRGPADPGNPHSGWTGSSGDTVGSRQADALISHSHNINGVHLEGSGGSGFEGTGLDSNSTHGGGWQKTMSTNPAGNSALETRPKNVSIMYVIYVGKK
jgi:hypothetical protein